MTSFQQLFGGNTVKASNQTYAALTPSKDIRLTWPIEQSLTGDDVVADIISVIASAINISIFMPDARQASTGYSTTVINNGALSFAIKTATGGSILSPAPGTAWVVLLTSNVSGAGIWQTFQLGATVAAAQASALAGIGLVANSGTLRQNTPVTFKVSSPYVILPEDVASLVRWTGAVGIFELSSANTYGGGFFTHIYNGGSGTLTIDPVSTIDGASTKILAAGQSCIVFTDGADWYTLGLSGTSSGGAFDYTSISIAGGGNYTLSGAELSRISYNFTGIVTADRTVIVPASIQQYWISNSTTGAFRVYIKTAAQSAPGIEVVQGTRAILYCDGTNVVDADTNTITFPISIAQGGTGGVTQADARTGLGAGAVGAALFVSANSAAARTAIGATSVGSALMIAADATAGRDAIVAAGLAGNTFTATQELASINPGLLFRETDGSINSKRWYMVVDGNSFSMRLQDDAANPLTEHYLMSVSRAGLTPGAFSFGAPELQLNYATPSLLLNDSSAPASNRRWKIRNIAEGLYITAYNDDETNAANAIAIDRTGVNIDSITFDADTYYYKGDVQFLDDATMYKVLDGRWAGPQVRAKWNSSTTDRYLQFGVRDNLAGFAEVARMTDGAWTFNAWPTVSGYRMDHSSSAVKTVQSAKTSDIVLTVDPQLLVPVASGTYQIEVYLQFGAGVSGVQGIQFQLQHSNGGGEFSYTFHGVVDGVAQSPQGASGRAFITTNVVQFPTVGITNGGDAILIKGSLISSFDGFLQVAWSQFSSNANPTFMQRGSYIKATRIA